MSENWSRIITGMLLMLLSVTGAAEIYRWTDKDGNVHFTDQPRNKDAEKLDYHSETTERKQTEVDKPPPQSSREEIEKLADELRESRLKREAARREQQKEHEVQAKELACSERQSEIAELAKEIDIAVKKRAKELRSTTERGFDAATYSKKNKLKDLRETYKQDCQ